MSRLLDLTCPLDPDYPGNKGLVAAWVAVPELAAGLTLFDLLNTGRGNPNHGTLTNGPTWGKASSGGAGLTFDGSNDYVDLGSGLSQPGDFTVAILATPASTGATAVALGRMLEQNPWPQNYVLYQQSGNWLFNIKDGGGTYRTATGAAVTTAPTLVAGTLSGSTQTIYTNGSPGGSNTISGGPDTGGSQRLLIGGRWTGGGADLPFSGSVDAAWLYNRALSAAEIRDLYDQSRREWGQSEQYRWLDGVTYFLPGGGSVSGSASITDANDATTAAATVAVAASATITDATDTTTAASTVSVTATASLTDATDTTTSAATVAVAATASITDATDTTTAAGAVSVTATAALVDADDGATATGGSAGGGSASLVDADDAVAAVGAVAVAAAASLTDATDTTTSAGAVAVAGSGGITDATDTTTAAATVAVAGSVALTDGGDTTTSAATVSVTASAAISDATDTVTATASDGSAPVGDDTLYMFLAF